LNPKEALEMVDVAEEALDFNRISEEEVQLRRCVKLDQGKVYSYSKKNIMADNPNSACIVSFSHMLVGNRQETARLQLLHSMLKEPFFD
jgi:hypothetical protein